MKSNYNPKLQEIITKACSEKRTDSFQRSIPSNGFYYYDLKLKPTETPLKITDKPVKKLWRGKIITNFGV